MQPKVLLVDDDSAVRESLSRALASENYQVITAADGREALEKFYDGYIEVALLDLNLPGKSGWDTFERLTAVNPLLPIIIITARPDQYELAVVAGAAAIMEKPLSVPALVETIARLVAEPVELRLRRRAAQGPLLLPSHH